MNNKEFKAYKKEIKEEIEKGDAETAYGAARALIRELFANKEFGKIVEIFHWSFLVPKREIFLFEVAFALVETRDSKNGELVYESLLADAPHNSAVLNNLSNIKKAKGDIDTAWELIKKAYNIDPADEIVSKNYESLLEIMEERRYIDSQFQIAAQRVKQENEYVRQKLLKLIANSKKDPDFKDNQLPIPNWKFKILIETDEQRALSLRDQWLKKEYIRRTGKRGQYQEHIYQINGYIENALQEETVLKIPREWVDAIINLEVGDLESIEYFAITETIQKVKRKFREILVRDVDELYLNYITKNKKAVLVLAGSVVETVLIYYCEKKNIEQFQYTRNGKIITKKLYDADLGDLLNYFEEQHIFGDLLVSMGTISRISRNFVHPGKELRDTEELDQATVDLCFLSAIQIIKKVC